VTPVAGFPTTLNPILQNGFQPAFVDIELETLNLDPVQAEAAARYWKAKGIMFAHVLGNPPEMDVIMNIVATHNLVFLEDCCDALGSTYRGRPLGAFGAMSSYSFYPAHHITMGEGGFVVCSTAEQEKVIRSLREWGRGCYCVGKAANLSTKGSCGCRFKNWIPAFPDEIFDHKYVYEEIGYNLKPIELQCAMGLSQLNKLPDIITKRKANYEALLSIFKSYEEHFILPRPTTNADVSWFAFPLTVKDGAPFKRSEFCRFLEDRKIQTRNYFGGNLLLQPAYSDLVPSYGGYDNIKKLFPKATKATTDTFFLGTSPVITQEQTTYIQEIVNEFFKK
jgi:CDP-6-deoxy-D-xylo-4-hexulose-3-dehydrase